MDETDRHSDEETRDFGLPPELVAAVREAVENEDPDAVRALVEPLHAADVADLLQLLQGDVRRRAIGIIRPYLDPDVLAHIDPAVRDELVEFLPPAEVAAVVGQLDTDDAIGILEDLDEERRAAILAELEPETRTLVEQGLTYPEYSAGRLMQRELVAVPQFWTVGKTIDYLRAATELPDDFYDIYIVDPMYRLVGAVPLSRVLRSKRDTKVQDIAAEDIHTLDPRTDQEEVAYLFRKYGLVSAPVIDKSRRLLGIVTVDDVVDVIEEEAEDDLLKLSGVVDGDIYRTVLEASRSRVTWLLVNLGTAFLASLVIKFFDGTIERLVALAVLMPIVASMGGNAGTQSLAVAVRALAMRELSSANARRVVLREVLVGLLNGLIFATLAGAATATWFGDPMLGFVIGAAMVINFIVAGSLGTLIPLGLTKMKVDPAVASSVFLTTATDVIGFFAFLGLATLLLL